MVVLDNTSVHNVITITHMHQALPTIAAHVAADLQCWSL